MPDDPFLRVEYKNRNSVELLDLTASLMALGESYEEFAVAHGYDPLKGNVRLYIKELRSGSIIADLKAMLDQASLVIDHPELFAAFLTSLDDLIKFFLFFADKKPSDHAPSRIEARRVEQILEPVAKDGGSQIILQINGDVHMHRSYHYNSEQANVVQNQIQKYLGPSLPSSQGFQGEPLTLVQVSDDPKGQTGDCGVIERFSPKPLRLLFMNERAKRRILEDKKNPFKKVFLVDGEMSTAGGDRPAVYKIGHVRDSFDRDELG